MELTKGEIFDTKEALQKLVPQEMPGLTSLAILELIQALNVYLKPIDETRNKLLKQYSTTAPDGRSQIIEPMILVPDEKHEGRMLQIENPKFMDFMKSWDEIRELVVDIKSIKTLIPLPTTIKISPLHMQALKKLVRISK